jgi:hypothetical protein
MLKEPLDDTAAKRLIVRILANGTVSFSGHARQEMAKDALESTDCLSVLRGGWVEFSELVDGSWRYRVRTQRLFVVVAFRSEEELVVVTAWRAS